MRPASAILLVLVPALLSGCSEQRVRGTTGAGSSRQVVGASSAPGVPREVEPVLAALRRGDAAAAHQALLKPETFQAFRGWLNTVLVKGRTTRDEVITSFGVHYHDLDRPRRDDVLCIEYFLGDTASFTTLVLDF